MKDDMYSAMMRVEIPKGSNIKYEIKDGKLICDRVLHTPMSYIFNYGCFEETLAGDGDPLDVVLLAGDTSLFPGCYVEVRVIGVLVTSDESGQDEKIITVPVDKVDPKFSKVKDIKDLEPSTRDQIKFFFQNYKSLEKGKRVVVGDYLGKEDGWKIYRNSIVNYRRKKGNVRV
jgi:inorganic pyrophosphatase